MNIVDAILILAILLCGVLGYKVGFIRTVVSTLGTVVIFYLSYLFKNPLAEWFTFNLPFFRFFGFFKDITILNVVVYQLIAFLIIFSLLSIIYSLVVKLSGAIEKILKATIILGIPSKILGFIIGLIEGLFLSSIILMILTLPIFNIPYLKESKVKDAILEAVPIVSTVSSSNNKAINEITDLKETYEGSKEDFNAKTLDILLKYKVIEYDYAKKLYDIGKLDFKGAKKVINKYKK